MSKKVGRNQPCPCGSGKKYKHCCWGTDAQSNSKKRNLYLMIGALVAVAVVVITIMTDEASPPAFQPNQPGQAPAGKVWSSEHGHYHDAPGTAPVTIPADQALSTSSQPTPQPPGDPPPGKTWSPEHGHWHDALTDDSL